MGQWTNTCYPSRHQSYKKYGGKLKHVGCIDIYEGPILIIREQ